MLPMFLPGAAAVSQVGREADHLWNFCQVRCLEGLRPHGREGKYLR